MMVSSSTKEDEDEEENEKREKKNVYMGKIKINETHHKIAAIYLNDDK